PGEVAAGRPLPEVCLPPWQCRPGATSTGPSGGYRRRRSRTSCAQVRGSPRPDPPGEEAMSDHVATVDTDTAPPRYPLLTRVAGEAAGTFILVFIGLGALLYSG